MLFGKDETFSLIGNVLSQNDSEAYNPICTILYDDVGIMVNSLMNGIQKTDKDDVIQVIVFKMIRALPRFYQTSLNRNYSEQERNAYLKRAVRNEVNTFFRSKANQCSGLNDDIIADKDYFEKRIEARDEMLQSLKNVFEINTTPAKLIAFVYNRLLGALSGKNGKPQLISMDFSSKEISDLYEMMVCDLTDVLHYEIPQEVLEPLLIKVRMQPHALFTLSPRAITDSSNQFITKMKKTKNLSGDEYNE